MKDLFTSFKDNCGFGLLASIDNKPSHENLEGAITSLSNMMHRGAIAADGKTGDGSGLLMSIPKSFMKQEALKQGIVLPPIYAIAVIFSKDEDDFKTFEKQCKTNDLKVIMSRDVPVNTNALGRQALKSLPIMKQLFVVPNALVATDRFDALVYLTRKEVENTLKESKSFYVPSFSTSVLSYKGLIMPTHIKEFYEDLADPEFKISYCLFHQRFSTNTLPEWKLAQPFRMIAHNGEINSVTANRANIANKIKTFESAVFSKEEICKISCIIQDQMSDSASLDNFIEFLNVNGVDFFKAARSVLPAPWHNAPHMDTELRDFYEYASTCFEPWDGPAAVSMTDGRYIGCLIDRNGLRPAKYIITKDNKLLITSEYGVLDIDEDNIRERGKLKSGEMIGVDLKYAKVFKDSEINDYLKNKEPYYNWLTKNMTYLQEHANDTSIKAKPLLKEEMESKQRYFNYTLEVIKEVIKPMITEGKETTASMGDDTPLAAFSTKHRNFTDFFKQKFAQVTNPPIDPIREKIVMSLNTGFGETQNILSDDEQHAKRLKTITPFLSQQKFQLLEEFGTPNNKRYDKHYKLQIYSTVFKSDLKTSLTKLVENICDDVKNNGIRTVMLDDRELNPLNAVMPMLMVVGRLRSELKNKDLGHLVSIVVITGEVFDPHSAACMVGFGATAIFPYLLYYTVEEIVKQNSPDTNIKPTLKKVRRAMGAGLLKIMSKMGISTISSYRSSKLFDILGLDKDIVEDCFIGAHGLMPGLGYKDIESRIQASLNDAYNFEPDNNKNFALARGGYYKFRKGEEFHDYSKETINAIHKLSISGDKADYEEYKTLVDKRDKKFIRDFYKLKSDKEPINIDKVEPLESIFKRFSTAAMSLGSMSEVSHKTLAEAMNSIGAKSNSGEGGEDKDRFGTILNSKIKQVASGRFGVTPAYLRSAEELQIKVAQGAKPGEGGQLPGSKVTPLIAKLRYTKPGVTLISPPPHHDIYSIEDLAQLIYDLKQINPKAKISVKLVSTAGVGTIAAGVAKCYADKIIISGADGGTGAAPIGSIRFCGNPWELGLIEAHNALKANGLRGQVTLETDGGLKTGLDVVKAAILGAEEYAFGTAALAIVGCIMCRACHINSCPVGITTQSERLIAKYKGDVKRVINYFTLVGEDVREILATLGYNSLEEIIGKNDLLEAIDDEFAKKFSFDEYLYKLDGVNTVQVSSNNPFDDNSYEKEILKQVMPTIKDPSAPITIDKDICNLNRSFGALISGEIAELYGDEGLPKDSITFNLTGTAGQSLGAFLSKGMKININGVGNDYIGKGMNGGTIVISSKNSSEEFNLGGNTCLYGATGGTLYVNGQVGERFAVRNSGAITVVEGSGDHSCEYMTGGKVVILGKTGINFGAGMTGGVAFVYDENRTFIDNMNQELVEAVRIDTDEMDIERFDLKVLIQDYYNETKSAKAKEILEKYRVKIRNFWMVRPISDRNEVVDTKDKG